MNTSNVENYWKTFLGIDVFKIRYLSQYWLYKLFKLKLPKLKSQKKYWASRGQVYMDEIISSGYLDREIFFQNMLIDELNRLDFHSFFEAGCGFGWNIKRVKESFPGVRVGGLDFSFTQLCSAGKYIKDEIIPVVNGDNCRMPYKDNAFDIGFSLGVFMNIHKDKIRDALAEMTRVCAKYIVHIEYDDNHTTPELKEKRAFKTNIVSHDYFQLYAEMGLKPEKFLTYLDFGNAFYEHEKRMTADLNRWEGFEGPEKYIFIILKVP